MLLHLPRTISKTDSSCFWAFEAECLSVFATYLVRFMSEFTVVLHYSTTIVLHVKLGSTYPCQTTIVLQDWHLRASIMF